MVTFWWEIQIMDLLDYRSEQGEFFSKSGSKKRAHIQKLAVNKKTTIFANPHETW